MSTLYFFAFLGPISWFWHPHVYNQHTNVCVAEPGTYAAVFCPPTSVVKPAPYKTTWGFKR